MGVRRTRDGSRPIGDRLGPLGALLSQLWRRQARREVRDERPHRGRRRLSLAQACARVVQNCTSCYKLRARCLLARSPPIPHTEAV
jgi:hypothetical protein